MFQSKTHYTNTESGIKLHRYFMGKWFVWALVDLRLVSFLFYNWWAERTDKRFTLLKVRLLWNEEKIVTTEDGVQGSDCVCGISVAIVGLSMDIWLHSAERDKRLSEAFKLYAETIKP